MRVSSILGRNASCCDFKQLFPRLAGVALHGGTVVHGLTRKPPIGLKPDPVVPLEETKTGYSPAANAVAKLFVQQSRHGRFADP